MAWHVRFRFDGADHVTRHPNERAAVEAACRLMHDGCEVNGIGPDARGYTIGKAQMVHIYEAWKTRQPPHQRMNSVHRL
jgi:hypothetical protein